MSDKELVTKIYKELLQFTNKINSSRGKWTNIWTLIKEDTWISVVQVTLNVISH